MTITNRCGATRASSVRPRTRSGQWCTDGMVSASPTPARSEHCPLDVDESWRMRAPQPRQSCRAIVHQREAATPASRSPVRLAPPLPRSGSSLPTQAPGSPQGTGWRRSEMARPRACRVRRGETRLACSVVDRLICTGYWSSFTIWGSRSNSSARASRMVASMTSAAPGRS